VDSEHANLIYRCDGNGVTVVDKHKGSFGVVTPDVQRALDAKKSRDGDGEGALSFLKRTNRAFRNA
jgi:hypothetical protein